MLKLPGSAQHAGGWRMHSQGCLWRGHSGGLVQASVRSGCAAVGVRGARRCILCAADVSGEARGPGLGARRQGGRLGSLVVGGLGRGCWGDYVGGWACFGSTRLGRGRAYVWVCGSGCVAGGGMRVRRGRRSEFACAWRDLLC